MADEFGGVPVELLMAPGFSRAPGVREIADAVMDRFPETFDHLRAWQVDFWFDGAKLPKKPGCTTIATARVVPALYHAITTLDGLVVVKARWWAQATAQQREAVCFHELAHFETIEADEERGTEARLRVVKHDIEAFVGEARWYGDWRPEFRVIAEQLRLFSRGIAAPPKVEPEPEPAIRPGAPGEDDDLLPGEPAGGHDRVRAEPD